MPKRVWEHKEGIADGFTKKYRVKNLVYYEVFDTPEHAIKKEKRLKKYPRQWKINLINEMNPDWNDLYEEICK